MRFTKSEKYDKDFLLKYMMGPNCLKLLEALTESIEFPKAGRVLDLGCGTGLTSIFLAKEFGLKVFATDLWISASDNYRRFKEAGLDGSIVPIHAEAHALPYANEYFDAAVCVDAYHYFGRDEEYLDKHLAPLVKKGGAIAIVVPGLKEEHSCVPVELQPFLSPENFDTLHSRRWWGALFGKSKLTRVHSLTEYTSDEAWNDWLQSDNEYAVSDREMIKQGGGYFNFVSITAHRI
jgi:cyclopropane fatty-acyl-phospholipid synthase-like methyltransferase